MASAGLEAVSFQREQGLDASVAALRVIAEELPGLDSVYDRLAYIPVGWWLSEDDRARMVDVITSGW